MVSKLLIALIVIRNSAFFDRNEGAIESFVLKETEILKTCENKISNACCLACYKRLSYYASGFSSFDFIILIGSGLFLERSRRSSNDYRFKVKMYSKVVFFFFD